LKNIDNWFPTKYHKYNGSLRSSRNIRQVSAGSRFMVDLLAEKFDKCIPEYCNGKLLDLGCGHVPLYEAYNDHVDEIVCVDWAFSHHSNNYLDLEQDISQPLRLKNEIFETVILSDVLEHLRNPTEVCKEISRVMRIDGYLIVSVPFMYWLHEEPHDYYRYTKYGLTDILTSNGFEIVELHSCGGGLDVIVDIFSKLVVRLPVIGNYLAIVMSVLFGKISKIVSTKSDSKFPLFYFVIAKKTSR